jgi:hypothetical protein
MTAIVYGNLRVEVISDTGACVQRVGLRQAAADLLADGLGRPLTAAVRRRRRGQPDPSQPAAATAGSYQFTVTAMDSADTPDTGSQAYTLDVQGYDPRSSLR